MTTTEAAGARAGHKSAGHRQAGTRLVTDRSGTSVDLQTAATRQRNRLFRAARRHTFFVRLLRVLLPAIVIGCFGYYGLLLKLQFGIGSGTFSPGKIEITSEDLKMKNPSYFGVTKENGKYQVHAREAAVDFSMTGPVKLEGIDGNIVQANGVRTNLRAVRGALDNKKGELELFDGVEIDATNGMKAWLRRAMVYTKDHRVVSTDPVSAEMPTGTLTANAMEFSTNTRVGRFRGNVGLRLIQPPAASSAPKASIGIGGDARQPVDIRAQEFDIDDLKSLADFRGNVVARQGETQLTAPELHVTYEGQASAQAAGVGSAPQPAMQASPAEPASGAQLTRLVARTGVVLTAGADRRITAEVVDFDVKADTALFTGNVELTQAKNIFRGGRLAVDRKSGKSRLDTPALSARTPPGRIVATLIQAQSDAKSGAAAKLKLASTPDAIVSPFGGFRSDPNAPTDIDAESLEINDLAKQAIFRGKVVAKQGDYVIQTAELVAAYTGQTGLMSGTPNAGEAAQKGGLGGAQLSQIETKGGTKIITKDGQEAEGATAHFDIKANTVTMAGPDGVILKHGQNYTRGARLKVDMTTGEAHVEQDPNATSPSLTAAQKSIPAKPGVAPPVVEMECPTGGKQTCIKLYPKQLKELNEQRKRGAGAPETAAGAPSSPPKPKPEPWQPQSSPSQVYRSN